MKGLPKTAGSKPTPLGVEEGGAPSSTIAPGPQAAHAPPTHPPTGSLDLVWKRERWLKNVSKTLEASEHFGLILSARSYILSFHPSNHSPPWCHYPHSAGKEMPMKRAWVANPGPIVSGQQSWVTNKPCLGFNAMVSPWGHRHSWQNPGVNWVSSRRPHPVRSFCLSISPSPSSSINSHRSSRIFHPKWVVTGNADMVHGSPL